MLNIELNSVGKKYKVKINKILDEKSNYYFVIRSAKLRDSRRIAELDYEAFSPSNTHEDEIVFKNRIHAFPAGCIVLEIENIIIGYATSEKWLHEREPEIGQDAQIVHQPSGNIFCITAIAVQKEYQRRQLGSKMLETLMDIAKQEKCTCIVLETGKPFWYEKFGFWKIGYRTQNNALMSIMRLVL